MEEFYLYKQSLAGAAKEAIEKESGNPVITDQNATQLNHVVTQMIEASVEASEHDSNSKIDNQ